MKEQDPEKLAQFVLYMVRNIARRKRKAINRARYERSYKRGPK